MKLEKYFEDHKLIIFAGNGGTGKTTLSAAFAMEAAESGRNVGLITIDPSRRLGTAFDMDVLTETHKRKIIGEKFIDVFLIDSEKVIRDFVTQVYSEEYYTRLQANRLFSQISHALAENQSISTIYQLAEMIRSEKYDLIVVDTPPANHAMDFFTSPQHVYSLFHENLIAKAVMEAKSFKFWSTKKLFIKVLSSLVGESFVTEMESFFNMLFAFQDHIVQSAKRLETTLRGADVSYIFVTLPELQRVEETSAIIADLKSQGFSVGTVVINRSHPEWLDLSHRIEDIGRAGPEVENYYDKVWNYYHNQKMLLEKPLQTLQKELAVYFVPEKPYFDETFSLQNVTAALKKVFV